MDRMVGRDVDDPVVAVQGMGRRMMIGEAYCDAYIWLLKADEAVTRHRNERHLLGCTIGKLGKAAAQATVSVEEMGKALELLWEEKWVEGGEDGDR